MATTNVPHDDTKDHDKDSDKQKANDMRQSGSNANQPKPDQNRPDQRDR